jgi:hypothetical protein
VELGYARDDRVNDGAALACIGVTKKNNQFFFLCKDLHNAEYF